MLEIWIDEPITSYDCPDYECEDDGTVWDLLVEWAKEESRCNS